jgi:hypothetical protein
MSDDQILSLSMAQSTDGLFQTELNKAIVPQSSSVGRTFGRQTHPINMAGAINLMFRVSTQQTCIQTKRDATVGLGFETEEDRQKRAQKKELDAKLQADAVAAGAGGDKPPGGKPAAKPVKKAFPPAAAEGEPPVEGGGPDPADADTQSKVEKALDPLCEDGFQSLVNQVGEDYENTGNGYFEVIRESGPGSNIVALWHLPAPTVFVFCETGDEGHYHFEMDSIDGRTKKFARFGDLQDFLRRYPNQKDQRVSEIVRFKMPTSVNPHYGVPQWCAVTPWLEMAAEAMGMEFDFFQNRAVPDLLGIITGGKVADGEFKKLQTQLKETIGPGKRFRTLLINFPNPGIEVNLERLQNGPREKLSDNWPTIELAIVSAHRIPALLAGIQTPGKMAAANELPNALIAFQTLYVAQHQRIFQQVLGNTLGKETGLGLKPTDFMLRRITDSYDMGQVDTMSRMRQTATEASLEGRKLDQGLKE